MGTGGKHTPEQIVNLLRQIEVATANGKTNPAACKETEFRPLHLVMDEWYPFVLQEPAG